MQAIGDAGEDDGEVGGAEGSGEEGEAGGGRAKLDRGGELLAIVDQFADGALRTRPRRLGMGGDGAGSLGGSGHETKREHKRRDFVKDEDFLCRDLARCAAPDVPNGRVL